MEEEEASRGGGREKTKYLRKSRRKGGGGGGVVGSTFENGPFSTSKQKKPLFCYSSCLLLSEQNPVISPLFMTFPPSPPRGLIFVVFLSIRRKGKGGLGLGYRPWLHCAKALLRSFDRLAAFKAPPTRPTAHGGSFPELYFSHRLPPRSPFAHQYIPELQYVTGIMT